MAAQAPQACYALVPANRPGRRIVIVRRGEHGYHLTSRDASFIPEARAREIVDELNQALGIKPAEAQAMLAEATREETTDGPREHPADRGIGPGLFDGGA